MIYFKKKLCFWLVLFHLLQALFTFYDFFSSVLVNWIVSIGIPTSSPFYLIFLVLTEEKCILNNIRNAAFGLWGDGFSFVWRCCLFFSAHKNSCWCWERVEQDDVGPGASSFFFPLPPHGRKRNFHRWLIYGPLKLGRLFRFSSTQP